MLSFVCDYSEGAHPRILERLESVYTPKGPPGPTKSESVLG